MRGSQDKWDREQRTQFSFCSCRETRLDQSFLSQQPELFGWAHSRLSVNTPGTKAHPRVGGIISSPAMEEILGMEPRAKKPPCL